uniref:F-box domain-containing protein n=1 Tax=Caenorhabditis tropicalis TaxID=1561998 RepID=A0A1I7UT71_9PELO
MEEERTSSRQPLPLYAPFLQSTNRFPSTMSFPLLRLPHLALEEIVKSLSHREVLFLSQTSLRARRQISNPTKSHSITTRIVDDRLDSCVEIFCPYQLFYRIKIDNYRREPSNSSWRFKTPVPVYYEKDNLISHWTKNDTGVHDILDFLNEIFRIKQVSFEINLGNSDSGVKFLEYCVSKNLKIGLVQWNSFIPNDETNERILMASKSALNLKIRGYNSKNSLHFDNFHLFRMDWIEIKYSAWMTVENIVDLRNCKRVKLGEVLLNAEDINKVLRGFMENPGEMQELQMDCCNKIKLEEVVEGLHFNRQNDREMYWLTSNNGIRFSVSMMLWSTVVIARES